MDPANYDIKKLIGKRVYVIADRPIGYKHGGITYPINYGYIPGLIAVDGEEQDVYILDVSEPVSSLEGAVIAIIRRKNDNKDKLVVAPKDLLLKKENCKSGFLSREIF